MLLNLEKLKGLLISNGVLFMQTIWILTIIMYNPFGANQLQQAGTFKTKEECIEAKKDFGNAFCSQKLNNK